LEQKFAKLAEMVPLVWKLTEMAPENWILEEKVNNGPWSSQVVKFGPNMDRKRCVNKHTPVYKSYYFFLVK
jgi:hypothetical protein